MSKSKTAKPKTAKPKAAISKAPQPAAPTVFTKLDPAKPSKVYDTYWTFAAERQAIFFRRIEQPHGLWTKDPILARHKFTNAYRASDRVSQYLIRNVIYQGPQDTREVFFRTVLFKLFNKIDTWELLERSFGTVSWEDYRFGKYDKLLSAAINRGDTIYSAAYIMPMAAGFEGDRKHQTHLRLLERMMKQDLPNHLADARSLKLAYEKIREYPMMGPFLAFQFLIDLNYSPIINFPEMEFVVPGPGARDGIKKCFETTGGLSETDIIRLMAERQDIEFERLGISFQSLWGRPLQLIDCQNIFCEVDKYARVAHPDVEGLSGRSRIKQMYKPAPTPIPYWYPPKWDINSKIEETLQRVPPLASATTQQTPSNPGTGKSPASRPIAVSRHAQQMIPFDTPLVSASGPTAVHSNQHCGDTLGLDEYQDMVKMSRRYGNQGVSYALLGLYGETGSLLSELKKKRREAQGYPAFAEAVTEEFGDVLWYLADLALHAQIRLSSVAETMLHHEDDGETPAREVNKFADLQNPRSAFGGPTATDEYQLTLMRIGAVAGEVLAAYENGLPFVNSAAVRQHLAKFLRALVKAADAANISLEQIAIENKRKIFDRWRSDGTNRSPLFDIDFEPDEQLPRHIEMTFIEKTRGEKKYVIQKLHGVIIGDRLTDNMVEDDGYRFHDVFHLSYAAILGWSPVTRVLLRRKRKSKPQIDEVQDGARAIIVEEGVSTWIFSHAAKRDFFEGQETVDYSLLKSIRRLVTGFEVEQCPLWQWERAILEGFHVFRQMRHHRGGIVTADLNDRRISFRESA